MATRRSRWTSCCRRSIEYLVPLPPHSHVRVREAPTYVETLRMYLNSAKTRNVDAYRELHRSDDRYGKSSHKLRRAMLFAIVSGLRCDKDWRPATILDFGCGKSTVVFAVASALRLQPFRYDPAIPEYQNLPVETADIVLNTDVLEHLDEDELDLILDDISGLSLRCFFNISTRPASKTLPSGENAHATVKPKLFWEQKLSHYFPQVHDISFQDDAATFVTWKLTDPRKQKLISALSGQRLAQLHLSVELALRGAIRRL